MSDFSLGLPDKNVYDPISQKGRTRLVIQLHTASRAGKHHDIRLHDGAKSHSWAARYFPLDRAKTLAVRQPTHKSSYSNFQGEIKSGYGKGFVRTAYNKKINVISADENKIKLRLPEGNFTMIKPKNFGNDKNWLMIKNAAFIDELEKIASKNLYKNLWAGGNNTKHNKLVLKWIDLVNKKNYFSVSRLANEKERIRNLKILSRIPKIKKND
jgi:hypothetical protein